MQSMEISCRRGFQGQSLVKSLLTLSPFKFYDVCDVVCVCVSVMGFEGAASDQRVSLRITFVCHQPTYLPIYAYHPPFLTLQNRKVKVQKKEAEKFFMDGENTIKYRIKFQENIKFNGL